MGVEPNLESRGIWVVCLVIFVAVNVVIKIEIDVVVVLPGMLLLVSLDLFNLPPRSIRERAAGESRGDLL